MVNSSLYEALASAANTASAITLRANLIPANALPDDGKFFVLPPTYAEIGHLASPAREDGTHQYILIESTQSWANRLEELLDNPEVGVGGLQVTAAGRTLSVNQLPHRIFDALLRDSELAGQPFRATPLGQSLTEARADNATALLENAPGTLLFGAWDSFAGAKMGAAKWPAALSGQIMGFDALQTQKAGIRIDPMNIAKDAVTGFKSESRAEGWTIDETRAVKDAKGKPVPLETLKAELRGLHSDIRQFYEDKEEDILGNLHLYDPVFGWINLIVTLRIGIYHDQLHFDDVIKQFNEIKQMETP
jgi:CRISPR-associated protein Csb1